MLITHQTKRRGNSQSMANRITAVAAAAMIAGAGLLSGLVSPQVAQAEGVTNGWQCAQFARLLSGIEIFGDAYTWWRQAMGKYARGSSPDVGAVLVFKTSPTSMISSRIAIANKIRKIGDLGKYYSRICPSP